MARTFSDLGPPLADADLAADRNGLGFPLPAAYRDWLLRTNGGVPAPQSFTTLAGKPSKRLKIERFLSLRPVGAEVKDDAQSLYHHLVSEVGLPPHYLPVARGPGPVLYFVDVRPADDGEVWQWNMFGDTYEFEADRWFVKVCDGFARLLAALGEK